MYDRRIRLQTLSSLIQGRGNHCVEVGSAIFVIFIVVSSCVPCVIKVQNNIYSICYNGLENSQKASEENIIENRDDLTEENLPPFSFLFGLSGKLLQTIFAQYSCLLRWFLLLWRTSGRSGVEIISSRGSKVRNTHSSTMTTYSACFGRILVIAAISA